MFVLPLPLLLLVVRGNNPVEVLQATREEARVEAGQHAAPQVPGHPAPQHGHLTQGTSVQ